jgi:hypothetical protein
MCEIGRQYDNRQWKKRRRSIVVKYEKAVQAEIIHLSKVDLSRRNAADRLVVRVISQVFRCVCVCVCVWSVLLRVRA